MLWKLPYTSLNSIKVKAGTIVINIYSLSKSNQLKIISATLTIRNYLAIYLPNLRNSQIEIIHVDKNKLIYWHTFHLSRETLTAKLTENVVSGSVVQ